ncbi:MAG: hypothetical protein E6501_35485, partial [Bradyrhizobium sp.]|nr:hypothetical protein [Bradyrhizobium sp.]
MPAALEAMRVSSRFGPKHTITKIMRLATSNATLALSAPLPSPDSHRPFHFEHVAEPKNESFDLPMGNAKSVRKVFRSDDWHLSHAFRHRALL